MQLGGVGVWGGGVWGRDAWCLCAVILQKKCPDFGKMCTVCVYRWFKFSKRSIKSIFDKKHQNFSLLGTAFMCRPRKVYRNTPISRNLLCHEKLLVARLIYLREEVISLYLRLQETSKWLFWDNLLKHLENLYNSW